MNTFFGEKYHETRNRKLTKYRFRRRFEEVYNWIKDHNDNNISILDIGASDGIVLNLLSEKLNLKKAVGIDIEVPSNKFENVKLIKGDAENLPFKNEEFNYVISSSVIQYIRDRNKMLQECHRVLKDNGYLVITAPSPFQNKIAHTFNYYKQDEEEKNLFYNDLSMKQLNKLFKENNFKVVLKKKFILFPFGKIPFEKQVESFLRFIKLDFLMSNQIIVGIKCKQLI
ncbi:MAG: class I SAM-dependent methyltransferase [Candidatus Nanoarchaeia archaeon]|nr:class I SAM-dependent methyltransferase [Candidatus Nanoarchaeia archaeon]